MSLLGDLFDYARRNWGVCLIVGVFVALIAVPIYFAVQPTYEPLPEEGGNYNWKITYYPPNDSYLRSTWYSVEEPIYSGSTVQIGKARICGHWVVRFIGTESGDNQ